MENDSPTAPGCNGDLVSGERFIFLYIEISALPGLCSSRTSAMLVRLMYLLLFPIPQQSMMMLAMVRTSRHCLSMCTNLYYKDIYVSVTVTMTLLDVIFAIWKTISVSASPWSP